MTKRKAKDKIYLNEKTTEREKTKNYNHTT